MRDDVKATIEDLVSAFLYYDRGEDDELPLGEIERQIIDGELSVIDIVDEFHDHLRSGLQDAIRLRLVKAETKL